MADRLTIITTRTGDGGQTGLADGSRVSKTHPRVVALGDVDELNSHLGRLLTELDQLPHHEALKPIVRALKPVQHVLFDVGSELAIPGYTKVTDTQLTHLDKQIEHFNAQLPSLKEFILPGGSSAAAQAHVVRSVCRRAERSVIAVLEQGEPGSSQPLELSQRYLNRLSDLMFILARSINQALGSQEVLWNKTP